MPLLELNDVATLCVRDIMQRRISTIHAEAPISEAARVLWDDQVGGAPVVDASGRTIGFISASDVVRYKAYGARYRPPSEIMGGQALAELELTEPLPPRIAGTEPRVRDLMTPATLSVRADTSLPELARFLTNARIHRALVTENCHVVGIVSAYDIVQQVAAMALDPAAPLLHDDDEC